MLWSEYLIDFNWMSPYTVKFSFKLQNKIIYTCGIYKAYIILKENNTYMYIQPSAKNNMIFGKL